MFRIQKILEFINLKNLWPKLFILISITLLISVVTGCNTSNQKVSTNILFINNSTPNIPAQPSQLTQEHKTDSSLIESTRQVEYKNLPTIEEYGIAAIKEDINVILKTKDNIERNGVLSLTESPKGNIIICHPASYDKEFMKVFNDHVFKNYNCLRFDFRRHGENNKKQYSTLGKDEVYDVEAAIDIIKSHPKTKDLPTYGFGISLGAAVLIETESKINFFEALILQSSFESLRKQIKRVYRFYDLPLMHNFIFREPTRFIARVKYRLKLYKVNPAISIKNIKKPIFLIHSRNDNYITFKAFEALYEAGKNYIAKIWTPEGGFHTKVFNTYPLEYSKHCNDFLDEIPKYRTLLKR